MRIDHVKLVLCIAAIISLLFLPIVQISSVVFMNDVYSQLYSQKIVVGMSGWLTDGSKISETHTFNELKYLYSDIDIKKLDGNLSIYVYIVQNMSFLPTLCIALIIGYIYSFFVYTRKALLLVGIIQTVTMVFLTLVLHNGLNCLGYHYELIDYIVGVPIIDGTTIYTCKLGVGWFVCLICGIISIWYSQLHKKIDIW